MLFFQAFGGLVVEDVLGAGLLKLHTSQGDPPENYPPMPYASGVCRTSQNKILNLAKAANKLTPVLNSDAPVVSHVWTSGCIYQHYL
jgi:hypothetical protein